MKINNGDVRLEKENRTFINEERLKQNRKFKINEEIKAKRVRVVGPDEEKLGILSLDEALKRANNLGLDLVEIVPKAEPPVCRIVDYGKLKYEQGKKQKEQKKQQQKVVVKIIKVAPNIAENDLLRKIGEAQKFINENYQVTVQLVLPGRMKMFSRQAEDKIIERFKSILVGAHVKEITRNFNKIIASFAPTASHGPK